MEDKKISFEDLLKGDDTTSSEEEVIEEVVDEETAEEKEPEDKKDSKPKKEKKVKEKKDKPKKEKKEKPKKEVDKKTKLAKLQGLFVILAVISVLGGGLGIYKLCSFRKMYKEGEKIYEGALEYVTENPEYVEGTEDDVKVAPYNIDFVSLQAVNGDIVGWIKIPDTQVDYPVLYSHNNKDYLRTTYDGKGNTCGSIFIDCACNNDFSSANTIIYGHNMHDGTMFKTLNLYMEQSFYNEHPYVWICTPTKQTKYNIIAVYRTTFSSNTYFRDFVVGSDEYKEWLEYHKSHSEYPCTEYDVNLPTITLSTCVKHNSSSRTVVILQEGETIEIK